MKKKKGFTLIELLSVIAIIGIISLIAIPNILNISTGVRKDQMISDAKKLISLAKYMVNRDYSVKNFTNEEYCDGNSCTFNFDALTANGEIGEDPDGGEYERDDSFVIYRMNGIEPEYCVSLIGSMRAIGAEECIIEKNLHSRSNVTDIIEEVDGD